MSERHPFEDEFKRRVIEARRTSALTLREVEAKSGVPFNTISRVERGKGISFGNALRLAEALGIPLHDTHHQRRPQMTTVYASIGNSDDKLTQRAWSDFGGLFVLAIKRHAHQVHGIWYSLPDSRYQNLCACFEIDDFEAGVLKPELAKLGAQYQQDSIAWATAETEFIGEMTEVQEIGE